MVDSVVLVVTQLVAVVIGAGLWIVAYRKLAPGQSFFRSNPASPFRMKQKFEGRGYKAYIWGVVFIGVGAIAGSIYWVNRVA